MNRFPVHPGAHSLRRKTSASWVVGLRAAHGGGLTQLVLGEGVVRKGSYRSQYLNYILKDEKN